MRNPYETIPSLLKMLQTEWGLRGRDERLITKSLRVLADQSIDSYQHPLDVLAKHPDVRSSVVDYRELILHPETTMRRIYQELDLELWPGGRQRIRVGRARAAATNPPTATALRNSVWTPSEIHTRLAALFDQYQWDTEGEDVHVR